MDKTAAHNIETDRVASESVQSEASSAPFQLRLVQEVIPDQAKSPLQ